MKEQEYIKIKPVGDGKDGCIHLIVTIKKQFFVREMWYSLWCYGLKWYQYPKAMLIFLKCLLKIYIKGRFND